MRLLKGHDPYHGLDGTDVLVTIHHDDDGTADVLAVTVALRPGRDRTALTWGPPVVVEEVDP